MEKDLDRDMDKVMELQMLDSEGESAEESFETTLEQAESQGFFACTLCSSSSFNPYVQRWN